MWREVLSSISWRPEIGDPTVVGWVTCGAYFIVAFLSARVMIHYASIRITHQNEKNFYFWIFLTLFMIFLGFNKQFDLQTFITEFFRGLAKYQEWYASRRVYQAIFTKIVAVIAVTVLVVSLFESESLIRSNSIAFTGIILISLFIILRMSSFTHVDSFIKRDWMGMKMNWILELAGIALVGLGTIRKRE